MKVFTGYFHQRVKYPNQTDKDIAAAKTLSLEEKEEEKEDNEDEN